MYYKFWLHTPIQIQKYLLINFVLRTMTSQPQKLAEKIENPKRHCKIDPSFLIGNEPKV